MDGYLKQSTASQARLIGPFIDDSDFKTAETGLTIANTDIKLRANGTTLSNKNSGGGTHQANGMYSVTWDATDTANVGELKYSVVVSGALQVFGSYVVLEEAVYDALFGASAVGYVTDQPVNVTKVDGAALGTHASGYFPGDVRQFGGSAGTFASGRPEVNTTHLAGTSQTARDIGASVLLSSGSGTGQLDFTSGVVKSNLTQIGGVAQSASDLKDFADDGYDPATNKVQGVVLVDTTTDVTNGSTLQEIVDGVLDEPTADHQTAGTIGKAISDAGSAGDPWGTALPGAYTSGTAGNIVGNRLDAAVTSRLAPTTAGRTLDVSATGEAGLDWANIGSSTSSVNLSGTTVKTATDVETDTQDIQGRLPAALTVGGNMKSDALAISGDTTAADNAESFFDGTGYAGTNNTIPTVTTVSGNVAGSVGSVSGNVGGNVTGSVGSLAAQAKADVNAEVVDGLTVDIVADSVAADGSRPTIAQAVYAIKQFLEEREVVGTAVTVKKPDGTTLMTFTLNDATTPTSITRAS